MNRRRFLAVISCLPFLGFLKPVEPTVLIIQPHMEESARALVDSEYFRANIAKVKESQKWFDGPALEKDFDEYNGEAFATRE